MNSGDWVCLPVLSICQIRPEQAQTLRSTIRSPKYLPTFGGGGLD